MYCPTSVDIGFDFGSCLSYDLWFLPLSPMICADNLITDILGTAVSNDGWLGKYFFEGGVALCNAVIMVVQYI